MPTDVPSDTDARVILQLLLQNALRFFEDELIGLYLYDSTWLGDFQLLIVTRQRVSKEKWTELHDAGLHVDSGPTWTRHLEQTHISESDLRSDQGRGNWVLKKVLIREHSATIFGPPPMTLITPVPIETSSAAARFVLRWWIAQRQWADWLRPRHNQAFAILQACRALHAVESGAIIPKFAAAVSAIEAFPAPWPAFITRALDWRYDKTGDDLMDLVQFFQFVNDRVPSV